MNLSSGKPQDSRTHCSPSLPPPQQAHGHPSTHTPPSVSFLLPARRREADRQEVQRGSALPPLLSGSLSFLLPPACPSPLPHTRHQLNLASPLFQGHLSQLGQLHIPQQPTSPHLTDLPPVVAGSLKEGLHKEGGCWFLSPRLPCLPSPPRVIKQPGDHLLPVSLHSPPNSDLLLIFRPACSSLPGVEETCGRDRRVHTVQYVHAERATPALFFPPLCSLAPFPHPLLCPRHRSKQFSAFSWHCRSQPRCPESSSLGCI